VFEQVARRLRSVPASFFLTCAATASRPTPSTSVRSRAAGRHEAEFDAFLLGAIAESKVDNPVRRPASRTPSTRRRHQSFSAQDWEDALEGQEPFAGGAAPAEAPFADDGPDTQSHKGDDDDGDDFD